MPRDEDFVTKIFVGSTHTPVLFFSSRGMVYKMKVWRLPAATPQSVGKALINLLPLQQDERITTILPLPEDESTWAKLDVMFATKSGNIRRNSLDDFSQINRNGKIAMKLDEGDLLVDVLICETADDVLLTTANGRCIRFAAEDVRLFKSRGSDGVRGIRLDEGDTVISMAILTNVEATPAERTAYLKQAAVIRRAQNVGDGEAEPVAEAPIELGDEEGEEDTGTAELSPERYGELSAKEQFILTVSEKGFGKRSSAYEYRQSGRGGKGITAMVVNDRNGKMVAAFPIADTDQIMLVTDGGKLIRTPVHDVRIAGRNTQGVRVFRTEDAEKVVSVERVPEEAAGEDGANGDGAGGAATDGPTDGGGTPAT
jgi:DNA gyrase subunit A